VSKLNPVHTCSLCPLNILLNIIPNRGFLLQSCFRALELIFTGFSLLSSVVNVTATMPYSSLCLLLKPNISSLSLHVYRGRRDSVLGTVIWPLAG